jgi:hypothetical protein
MRRNLLKGFGVILLVTSLWILLYEINIALFHTLYFNKMVSWIFLPQGLRIVAVIVFAELGVIGLFLGSLATIFIHGTILEDHITIALISAINPYIAVQVSRFLLNLNSLFTNLNAKRLILIALISALFNSASHQGYMHIRDLLGIGHDFMVMFIGDFFGSLILLYCMSASIKWIKHRHRQSKGLNNECEESRPSI